MIKILWFLKSKINSDFINKISNEFELKIHLTSSFDRELIYDIIVLEDLSIIKQLNEIQKDAILIYVLNENCNIFDNQNIHINYYIRDLLLYDDLYEVILKSKDILLKKANTVFLKSGKVNYRILKDNIIFIESYRNYIIIHTFISNYTLRYTLKDIQKKLGNEFVQSHKSYLINMNNILSVKEDFIEVKNGEMIPIGNKYKNSFYNSYNIVCK